MGEISFRNGEKRYSWGIKREEHSMSEGPPNKNSVPGMVRSISRGKRGGGK